MNALNHHTKVPLSLAAFAVALATLLPAAQAKETRAARAAAQEIYWVAENDLDNRRIERLLGREVRGEDGKRVGTLKDFIVDVKSGQAVLAVVSVGGVLGVGDTLRALPLRALSHAAGDRDAFMAPITTAQWQRFPEVKTADFDKGTLHLTTEHRRELADYQSQLKSDRMDIPDTDWGREDAVGRLVRASMLRNKPVHAAGEKIGDVEAVSVDLATGLASIVLDADRSITGVDQDFLVPVNRLEFGVWEKTIATNLTRDDFRQARRVDATFARDPDADRRDVDRRDVVSRDAPSPTGRDVVIERHGVKVANTLHAAVRTVEEYWETQPELAKLDLDATVEGDRLVLRGNVPSEKVYERAKDAAEAVVSGIKIENRIVIRAK